ncbi:MAG: DNA-binding protein [Chloroflexi bacterium]|nr:DNA-binding protein [Chloroflexota bacterium]
MRSILLDAGPPRTHAVVFDEGDEVMTGLRAFAAETGADAASLVAIGAFSDVTLGYFDLAAKDYRRIPVREQVEVVSLVGNITRAQDDDDPTRTVHAHVVVARADGAALGGHLLEAYVRPTLEVIATESPRHLRRRHDPATGLALIDVDPGGRSEAPRP